MSSTEKLRFEARVTISEAAQQLEDLAKGLRSGTLLMDVGDEAIELAPSDDLKLDLYVRAQPEKRKARIEICLTWRSAEEPSPPRELLIRGGDAGVPQSLSRDGANSTARVPVGARKASAGSD